MAGPLGKNIKKMEKSRAAARTTVKGGKAVNPDKACPGCTHSFKREDAVSKWRHLKNCGLA
jgi:hypothetical protein